MPYTRRRVHASDLRTPWTSCPSGGRLLAPMTEPTPLASSAADATVATERLAAWVIGALTAIVIGGVALVIAAPHGEHAARSSRLHVINASLNAMAAVVLGSGDVLVPRRLIPA